MDGDIRQTIDENLKIRGDVKNNKMADILLKLIVQVTVGVNT